MNFLFLVLTFVGALGVNAMNATASEAHSIAILTEKHSSKIEHRKLLIIGCARSGTTYITNLLNTAGLKMGHEKVAKHGCVAWQAVIDTDYNEWFPWYTASKVKYKHIFHQVRDPLLVIASMYRKITQEDPSWWIEAQRYVTHFIPQINEEDSELLFCAKYWYYWNKLAEEKASWTFRIEDIDEVFDEIGERIGVSLDRSALKKVPKDVNKAKSHEDLDFTLTWADLKKEIPLKLFKNIKALAAKYNYPTTDEK